MVPAGTPSWWQLVRFAGDPLGLLDKSHRRFGGGLLRLDRAPMMAFRYLDKLIGTVWHSRASGETDARVLEPPGRVSDHRSGPGPHAGLVRVPGTTPAHDGAIRRPHAGPVNALTAPMGGFAVAEGPRPNTTACSRTRSNPARSLTGVVRTK